MSDNIIARKVGIRGSIVLHRPGALNAINLQMVREISRALVMFAEDDEVEFVTISSSSPRAFCAGGDLRTIREAAFAKDYGSIESFFTEEYRLNQYIADYPKPYIALMQGICMGGGLGLSVHGRHRIVSTGTSLAMPEVGIGFFTDIGASFFLNRLAGGLGMFLALTGARLDGVSADHAGLATKCVSDEHLAEMCKETEAANSVILAALVAPDSLDGTSELRNNRFITDCFFEANSLSEIRQRLSESKSDWSREVLNMITVASPTSVHTNFSLLQHAQGLSLKECHSLELQLAIRFVDLHDFQEGTRAMLVDKDRSPRWGPTDKDMFHEAWMAFQDAQGGINSME
jgi:enoyl-CoA hydratase/carnithine racemase